MLGHLVMTQGKGWRTVPGRERVGGLTFLRAEVPAPPGLRPQVLLRRLARGARWLAANGCQRVLTQEDFAYWEILGQYGLVPVETQGLCQALAAPLTLAALSAAGCAPERATVTLQGARVSRTLFQCALELAPRVRALCIAAPVDGQALAAYLRAEFGVPVLEAGAGCRPDLRVIFSEEEAGVKGTLRLAKPIDLLGLHILPKTDLWPADYAPLPLAAALWEAGVLEKNALLVR